VAHALTGKVERGDMTEAQAVGVAEKIMGKNAREIFRLEG
jgi:hypothetical protein